MKNIVNLLCASLLSLLLSGCEGKIQNWENVDTIAVTHSDIIDLESKDILNPVNVFKIDGYYVFRNHLTTKNLFTFMSDDCSKVYNGVGIGGGPNDVTQMVFLKRFRNDAYVMDLGHKTLNRLLLKGDSLVIEKVLSCNDLVVGSSFAVLEDNKFVAPTTPAFERPGMLALIDSAGSVKSLLEYPAECQIAGMDSMALAAFYCNTRVAVSPDEKHYAYGVYAETTFGFGDIEGDSFENQKTIVYEKVKYDETLSNHISTTRDNLMATATVVPSDKYAIFLYIGKPYDGPNKETQTLLLFTWSGELYKKVELDMELSTIDFDDKSKTLYGIAHLPEACLVKYDLSQLF